MKVEIKSNQRRIVYFRLAGENKGYRYGLVLNDDTEETIRERLSIVFESEITILEIVNQN